ncbi:cytochrome P450 1A1-like [Oppia nitens]|uniref:cytochrome P450 1A1-like n=1 Tax=Oppia nitens TaxID=1686743 RepID=UPI0023DAFBFE|nr:cytochrome P450 1A1-like [Oppia nitens]
MSLANYPPGPLPLPLLGNFSIYSKRNNGLMELRKLYKQYGPVMTVWVGPFPIVIISDYTVSKLAFKHTQMANRPLVEINKYGIMASDWGPELTIKRKITISAIRKYMTTDHLNHTIDRYLRQMWSEMLADSVDKQNNQSISVDKYFDNFMINFMSRVVFYNETYKDRFESLKSAMHYISIDLFNDINHYVYAAKLIPGLRYIVANPLIKYNTHFDEIKQYLYDVFKLRDNNTVDNIGDDMSTGADLFHMIFETKRHMETKNGGQLLINDEGLAVSIIEVFQGSIETMYQTFIWLILMLAYFGDEQQKLRDEINEVLGTDSVVQVTADNAQRLHYLQAFITETMRYRTLAFFGLPHRSTGSTTIIDGKYKIPVNCFIATDTEYIMHDPVNWPEPDKFNPGRFINRHTGHYELLASHAWMPYGVGARQCIGKCLSISNLLVILARFLQLTRNYRIRLDSRHEFTDDILKPHQTNSFIFQMPDKYRIYFEAN